MEIHCQNNGNDPSSQIAITHVTVGSSDTFWPGWRLALTPPPDCPQSDRSWEDKVLLRNVSRRDGGLYQCVSTDMDTFSDVSGNMTLTVNCKARAPVLRFGTSARL